MSETRQAFLTGERAEFFAHDRRYVDTIFDDGESPLKHAHDIELRSSSFKWKYPLWYCSDIDAKDCTWFEMARAGVWYTDHITVEDSTIEAPKNFRRCHDVTLRNVDFVNAEETLWACSGVTLDNVSDELRGCESRQPTFGGQLSVRWRKERGDFQFPSDFEGLFLELRERDGARFVHFRRVSGVELA